MTSANRREFLALAAALPTLVQAQTEPGSMFVCMHEVSSERFDFKTAMEGYAKAGIRAVEPNLLKVKEFADKESPATAKRLLDDLGLTPVSSSNQLGLPEPGDQRARASSSSSGRSSCAQRSAPIGWSRPSAGTGTYTEDDYKRGVDNMREAGEIARPFGVTLMLEHARSSRFVGLTADRAQAGARNQSSNVRVMMDTYHFWGGISKFEDLELLRNGELHHLHFEDVPADPPREIQGQPHLRCPAKASRRCAASSRR